MPQMMPINWIISFFFFLLIFILFNIMNYYIINFNMNKNNNLINTNFSKKKLWKW